jgi:penicillin amidase
MPAEALPGDAEMARYQSPGGGASQRLVVAPGREEQGIFHMPGGQSGHPLSPYYGGSHAAWAEGRPAALLAGTTVWELMLQP